VSGDATKAHVWANADVYTAASGSTGPTDLTTAWGVAWSAVGLLDGDEGFAESRSDDVNEFYAWGGKLVKTTKSKHKRQVKFSMLEDNDVTFALLNPGSTRTTASGVNTSTIKIPTSAEFAIGFETSDGSTKKRRYAKRATIDNVEDVVDKESGLTVYTVTVTVYPESDDTLWHEVSTA
jgi:hypothetical protein